MITAYEKRSIGNYYYIYEEYFENGISRWKKLENYKFTSPSEAEKIVVNLNLSLSGLEVEELMKILNAPPPKLYNPKPTPAK